MYKKEKLEKENKDKISENLSTNKKLDKDIKKRIKNDKRVKNHNNRIKDFIFKMASKPVYLKTHSKPIASSRQELYQEEGQKILGNRGMVFKSFKTEKERIEDYLKTRKTLYNMNKINVMNIDEKFIDCYKRLAIDRNSNPNKFLQPFMRFKPRNDLERLFESINKNSYGRISKKDIENSIRLVVNKKKELEIKKAMDQDKEIEFEDLDYQENIDDQSSLIKYKDSKKISNNIYNNYYKTRNSKSLIKNKLNSRKPKFICNNKSFVNMNNDDINYNSLDNSYTSKKKKLPKLSKSDAKFYLNEYHNKTHFKSAAKFSMLYGLFII